MKCNVESAKGSRLGKGCLTQMLRNFECFRAMQKSVGEARRLRAFSSRIAEGLKGTKKLREGTFQGKRDNVAF